MFSQRIIMFVEAVMCDSQTTFSCAGCHKKRATSALRLQSNLQSNSPAFAIFDRRDTELG